MELRPLIGQSEDAFEYDVQLYVEGQENSLDPTVLKALFVGSRVLVQPIGTCNSVESVAGAFAAYRSDTFFLVDQDYHHQDAILDWQRFRDCDTNLIVWRKKELENYFIAPDFLEQSEFIVNADRLREKLPTFCQQRLFLEVVNYVVVEIRETMKQNWIQLPTDLPQFSSYDEALQSLLELRGFNDLKDRVGRQTATDHITSLFERYFQEISGGQTTLEFGCGQWLDMMNGKIIFRHLLNNSGLFPATLSQTGESGRAKMKTIASRLLKTDDALPQDFIELREMIIKRANDLADNPNMSLKTT